MSELARIETLYAGGEDYEDEGHDARFRSAERFARVCSSAGSTHELISPIYAMTSAPDNGQNLSFLLEMREA